ncbi:zinc finger CCCH domain-containing protein 22 isoform X1 [Selaginella moellendorffii]|uniref:zinc finger CCCH domain-containing protein 22 isoform X1 n=1 Tax=Selaginella moellendorffii TaxID=88036 RepID=UPI000D1C8EB8|nr:zinc finger CCCH domain-containing protein 22 isoform X1 [Selaginella moellendorffii]|eukprot:XP_024522097.1 zinc finger CCCH domain-containing protein 22 isoform X1 [Selaginella moellendorffii]
MDAYEATQLVFARVQAQDPENVSKIIGLMLLQDRSEQEMARLALGSDALLQSAIAKARRELGLFAANPHPGLSDQHHHHRQHYHQQRINRPSLLFIPEGGTVSSSPSNLFQPTPSPDEFATDQWLLNHNHQFQLHQDPLLKNTSRFSTSSSPAADAQRRHLQQLQFPASHYPSSHDLAMALTCKPCLYYSKGHCKRGTSCRFLHGTGSSATVTGNGSNGSIPSPGGCSQCSSPAPSFDDLLGCSPNSSSPSSPSSGSLERLEMELQELLRGRRTPVSIASLPQLYFEKFGRALQAQGYLTESQRHGKAGCSLTKLLARLKGSVALIDRPHGQHAVVLAEDAQRFVGYRADRDDLKDVNPSSRQIYLTFPAESTFTEDDVSAHFRSYGPVQDVRIPYQQKRMFGFVTFIYPETVKAILSEGNPHYICGARVLVKPYREKAKLGERKQAEKIDPLRLQLRGLGGKDFMQDPSFYDVLARRFEEERYLELERRRVMDFHSLRARAAEVEAAEAVTTAKLLLLDEQERKLNSTASTTNLNGVHVSLDSPEVPGTPRIMEHNNSGSSSSSSYGNGMNEAVLTLEDMQQFQSSNPFGFVMDVLEGEGGDESEALHPLPDDATHKYDEDLVTSADGNGHNLPESPFASPHHSENSSNSHIPEEHHDQPPSLSIEEKMMGLDLNEVFNLAPPSNDIICCICLKHCVEPSKLECSHTFCVQCILKVIKGSKDECPICRQHIGSQVYKILQNRDLQSWLSPTALSHRIPQHIW